MEGEKQSGTGDPSVGAQAHFNSASFTRRICVPAIRCPVKNLNKLVRSPLIRGLLLRRPQQPAVVGGSGNEEGESSSPTKIVLLDSGAMSGLKEGAASLDRGDTAVNELIRDCGGTVTEHFVELGWKNFSYFEILRELLPSDVDVPMSFETVGHIAHLNLKEAQLPFKNLIGEVVLRKHEPQIRTVVNKTRTISSVFRNLPLEVLAGEADLVAVVRENGCVFRVDYGNVYWNSRLQREHARLVDTFCFSDVVCDMFAGIGPFAIPAARRRDTLVFANDLNPAAFDGLRKNMELNDVEEKIFPFQMDAREFVRFLRRKNGKNLTEAIGTRQLPVDFSHVIMNLPASSVEFLDVFVGLYAGEPVSSVRLPLIHCYCFSMKEDWATDVRQRIEAVLGASLPQLEVLEVRDVAPRRMMLCATFLLPMEVAMNATGECSTSNEQRSQVKRSRSKDLQPEDHPASKVEKMAVEDANGGSSVDAGFS